MIAFGLIPAVVIFSHDGPVVLDFCEVARDAGFYVVGLALLTFFMSGATLTFTNALILTSVYFFYLLAVAFPSEIEDDADPLATKGLLEVPVKSAKLSYDEEGEHASKKSDDESSESEEPDYCVLEVLRMPWDFLFKWSIFGGPLVVCFATIAWVGALSYLALMLAELLCVSFHISSATAGLTILAFGAQIPDTIAANELLTVPHKGD